MEPRRALIVVVSVLVSVLATSSQAQVPVFSNVWNVVAGTLSPSDLVASGNNGRDNENNVLINRLNELEEKLASKLNKSNQGSGGM